MKRRSPPKRRARKLTQQEIEAVLMKLGELIQELRKQDFPNAEDFAYEIELSRSNMSRHEKGKDMLVSTLLKIVIGLDKTPQEFFTLLENKVSLKKTQKRT
jgi:DNA-binding XRE family transcriptional regulator